MQKPKESSVSPHAELNDALRTAFEHFLGGVLGESANASLKSAIRTIALYVVNRTEEAVVASDRAASNGIESAAPALLEVPATPHEKFEGPLSSRTTDPQSGTVAFKATSAHAIALSLSASQDSNLRDAEIDVPRTPLPTLTLGQGVSRLGVGSVEYPQQHAPSESMGARVDLTLVQTRLRMKTEGARWAAERRRLLAENADYARLIEPNDREIIRKAKEIPGCYLWTNGPQSPNPADPVAFETLARCYANAATAAGVVIRLDEAATPSTDPTMQKAFQLLAESQSALRVAAVAIGGPEDSDQFELFQWLKTNTRDREIYVARHMRVNDPASPAESKDLSERLSAVESDVESRESQCKKRKKLFGKVRHKAATIAAGADNQHEAWGILASTIEKLIDDGLPPSNRELREALLEIVDDLPTDLAIGCGLQRVLDEVDRFAADNVAGPHEPQLVEVVRSPEVARVRELLQGKSILLIGGERREDREKAIRDALGLSEIHWMKTSEQHQPLDAFEPYVAKSDVACVVLMIRWSRHGYGDVKLFCDRHDKPLVRLPGGYGVNQLAKQIMDQVGDRLTAVGELRRC